ncbi:unnamed protein product, partial [Meganyctiphanes norvegica]
MSISIVKEKVGDNLVKPISFYTIENGNVSNKVVEVKHKNENYTKPEERTYIYEVFHNPKYGNLEVKVKKEIEVNEEPMQFQDFEIKRKEFEIKDEPIAVTRENYQCSQGDKTFTQNIYPIKHQRTHTGKESYQCSHCDKAFFLKSSFIKHIRTHPEEKPYQCSHCDKAFSRKRSIIKHIRTHPGEKPFQCS